MKGHDCRNHCCCRNTADCTRLAGFRRLFSSDFVGNDWLGFQRLPASRQTVAESGQSGFHSDACFAVGSCGPRQQRCGIGDHSKRARRHYRREQRQRGFKRPRSPSRSSARTTSFSRTEGRVSPVPFTVSSGLPFPAPQTNTNEPYRLQFSIHIRPSWHRRYRPTIQLGKRRTDNSGAAAHRSSGRKDSFFQNVHRKKSPPKRALMNCVPCTVRTCMGSGAFMWP